MKKIFRKLKKLLSFPYPAEYEYLYNQSIVKRMYKKLLVAVSFIILFVAVLLAVGVLYPPMIGPDTHVPWLVRAHLSFLLFSVATIVVSVVARRGLYEKPHLYVLMCNIYGCVILFWSCFMATYMDYWETSLIPYMFSSICLSLAAMFTPRVALAVFSLSPTCYLGLMHLFSHKMVMWDINNIVLCNVLSLAIAISIYRNRVSSFYNSYIIEQKNNDIVRTNEELRRISYTDSLTGAYNRHYFCEVLPVKFEEMEREGKCACVMMIDIDSFKKFNDTYGHQEGDKCLVRVVETITSALPKTRSERIRYGGEEFLVLCEVESEAHAKSLGERIRMEVEDLRIENRRADFGIVTISVGLCISCAFCESDIYQMTERADKALYLVKNNGRNGVRLYSREEWEEYAVQVL